MHDCAAGMQVMTVADRSELDRIVHKPIESIIKYPGTVTNAATGEVLGGSPFSGKLPDAFGDHDHRNLAACSLHVSALSCSDIAYLPHI